MIEFKWVVGEDGWLAGPDATTRRVALNALVRDHALVPEQMEEDWDDARQLLSEVVALKDGQPVATAMLICDPERALCPNRIYGQAALAEHATYTLIETMEDLLITNGAPDPVFEYVEGTNGRMIPIPQFGFSEDALPAYHHLN